MLSAHGTAPGRDSQQLDYFAVLPACRAAGLGAKLLAALPGKEAGADAILIEAELPEKADDPAMAVRRLGFYARCGAVDTGWTEKLFGASWFRVLTLAAPGQQPMGAEDACRALADCYRRVIGEPKWRQYIELYRPDGTTGPAALSRTQNRTAALCGVPLHPPERRFLTLYHH